MLGMLGVLGVLGMVVEGPLSLKAHRGHLTVCSLRWRHPFVSSCGTGCSERESRVFQFKPCRIVIYGRCRERYLQYYYVLCMLSQSLFFGTSPI
ncbi:hypothetical protein F4781DRAFT_240206 [Annulohypoxylon bovei var. microspora]|nr:hypothetical protein F4781DRAFT_240206 [Annulohypoxylon bovei var. microspora]